MNVRFACLGLFACVACSSSSGGGPAPVLSDLTLPSTIAAGETEVAGTVEVSDTAGLDDAEIELSISGNGLTQSLPASPIEGASSSITQADVPIEILLSSDTPPGAYQVSIKLAANGETSNTLEQTVTVQ